MRAVVVQAFWQAISFLGWNLQTLFTAVIIFALGSIIDGRKNGWQSSKMELRKVMYYSVIPGGSLLLTVFLVSLTYTLAPQLPIVGTESFTALMSGIAAAIVVAVAICVRMPFRRREDGAVATRRRPDGTRDRDAAFADIKSEDAGRLALEALKQPPPPIPDKLIVNQPSLQWENVGKGNPLVIRLINYDTDSARCSVRLKAVEKLRDREYILQGTGLPNTALVFEGNVPPKEIEKPIITRLYEIGGGFAVKDIDGKELFSADTGAWAISFEIDSPAGTVHSVLCFHSQPSGLSSFQCHERVKLARQSRG